MSKHPKTIKGDATLSEAEQLMRKYNIHSLIVVDESGQLTGIIDSFSCM
jgi:CBS domain-containing protein